jgi:hypothetical protein
VRIAFDGLLVFLVGAFLVAGGLVATEAVQLWYVLYLAVPVGLAVALVIARRYSVLKAAWVGAAIAGGIAIAALLPFLTARWISGDFASGPECDGFCMTNDEGFAFALFILGFVALAASVAGGFIAAVASLAGVRPVGK